MTTMREYIALHRRALARSIACLTSLDTANALADILKSRYNERNHGAGRPLPHAREAQRTALLPRCSAPARTTSSSTTATDRSPCAESLCVGACDRHFGVGGDGIALIEQSDIADAKMRMFNRDGSPGGMAGGCLLLVAKYLHDRGLAAGGEVTIEAGGDVKRVKLFLTDGKATSARVDMGKVVYEPARVPVALPGSEVVDRLIEIGRRDFRNYLSVHGQSPLRDVRRARGRFGLTGDRAVV